MVRKTIKEFSEIIKDSPVLSDENLALMQTDERLGVQKLLASYYRKQEKQAKLLQEHKARQSYELDLFNQGIEYVAGIDEVGRGPLAGPVVAASVILPKNMDKLVGINDSKTLSHAKRVEYARIIKEEAVAYSIVELDNTVIDKVNILEATKLAMIKSVNNLPIKPNHLLIDALKIDLDIPQTEIVKGDQHSISIAAASIIAKVHRDELMVKYHELYPEFEFNKNMGYGTKAHLEALNNCGVTPIHRHSFSPVPMIPSTYKTK